MIQDFLLQRSSSPKLDITTISDDEIQIMIQSALRAPDHGRLKPYKFYVSRYPHTNLSAKLKPVCDDIQDKLARAPLVILGVTQIKNDSKINMQDQIACANLAFYNISLMANALSYASMWRTPQICYQNQTKQIFNLKEFEHILGFMYIGKRASKTKEHKNLDYKAYYDIL